MTFIYHSGPVIDIDEQEDVIHDILEEEEHDNDSTFELAESAESDKQTAAAQEGSTEEVAAKEGRKISGGSTDMATESETAEKDEAIGTNNLCLFG